MSTVKAEQTLSNINKFIELSSLPHEDDVQDFIDALTPMERVDLYRYLTGKYQHGDYGVALMDIYHRPQAYKLHFTGRAD